MQRYTVFCREILQPPNGYRPGQPTHDDVAPQIPQTHGEAGSCDDDEICVNGLYRRTGYSAVARCVKQEDFRILADDSGDSNVQLGNRMASVVLSREDASRPLGAGSMGAAYAESGQVLTREEMELQSQTCQDCFELNTPRLAEETDKLKVEASLVTAGAVAGVVWLAVLSG